MRERVDFEVKRQVGRRMETHTETGSFGAQVIGEIRQVKRGHLATRWSKELPAAVTKHNYACFGLHSVGVITRLCMCVEYEQRE